MKLRAIIIQDIVFAGHEENFFARGLQDLTHSVELFRLGQMADIAGMKQEFGRLLQRIDLVYRRLKRSRNIRVRRLVESHVAIANLYKTKLAGRYRRLVEIGKLAQAIRLQHAALHYAQRASAGPCHALQKSAAIDAVVVVIVQYFIFDRCHVVPSSECQPAKRVLAYLQSGARCVLRFGCPRRPGTCFAYSDRRGAALIPNSRIFIYPQLAGLGNKIPAEAVPSMNARVEGESLDALDPQDRARFEQLVLPHLDAAFNLSRWLLHGRADAEDVAQEATMRAFRFFRGFHGGDARAWLLQIVRNTCYTWLEKNRSVDLSTEFDEELHAKPSTTPEALATAGDNRERLTRALEELPVRFREVLILRELEGCSYKEIAAITSVPIGTVMSAPASACSAFLLSPPFNRNRQQKQGAARDL